MSGITAALISGGCAVVVGVLSLIGVMITNSRANSRMQNDMKVAQAVTDAKLEALTTSVNLHNNFAQRIPSLEQEQIANNRRLKNLEDAVQPIPAFETELQDVIRRVKVLECYHKPN